MDRLVPAGAHVVIWLLLLGLAGVNIALAGVNLAGWNGTLALAIAAVQATLIGVFLMQLRWSSSLVRLVALASLLWLAILIAGTLDDVLTRAWLHTSAVVSIAGR